MDTNGKWKECVIVHSTGEYSGESILNASDSLRTNNGVYTSKSDIILMQKLLKNRLRRTLFARSLIRFLCQYYYISGYHTFI